ncbi:dehydration-responsive element-binding protein 1D-like protein [Tanacetum coccineum]
MTTFIQFNAENIPTESCSTSDEDVHLASQNPKKRAGRKKFKETRHPVYRGVRKRDSGKWVCEVREPNKKTRVWLGTYPTADMAARAHDVAVLAMRGRSACLNFADSLWRLPVPESSNVKDIQKAAVKAAEAFRPVKNDDVALREESDELKENHVIYMDDDVVFGMQGFLADMAEGLMLPPPRSIGYDNCVDDVEFSVDVSLWSF